MLQARHIVTSTDAMIKRVSSKGYLLVVISFAVITSVSFWPWTPEYKNEKDLTEDPFQNCTKCRRPNGLNGVEDLFCMERPNYMKGLQNPCWYEDNHAVRCLPRFHLLGSAKCASTDLIRRLSVHPYIVPPNGIKNKSALWWAWNRYGYSGFNIRPERNFDFYTHFFHPLAEIVRTRENKGSVNYKQLITFDGSPVDFWDFRGWQFLPQNEGLSEPCVFTPHLMKHIYPDPKFLLIFRNPTERLYSDYFFKKIGESAEEFDRDVRQSVQMLKQCQKEYSIKHCLYRNVKLPARMQPGFYSVYIKEWFAAFPRDRFLILRTEDYTLDIIGTLDKIYKFLNLPPLPTELHKQALDLDKERVTKLKLEAGPMLPETKTILDKVYAPYNQELANILQDDKFLWK